MNWKFWAKPPVPAAPVPGICGERGGNFRVHWDWPDKGSKENAFLPLRAHVDPGVEAGDDGPTLELRRDYIGPLCPHELAILAGRDSSRALSDSWQIEVTAQ